jgi:hypothetical protein
MSPFTVGPQNGFPSSLEDMSQYGMHGLPYMTGLQNGHSSSMDSTPGGQYPMGTMSGGQQSNSSSMDSTFGGQYPMGTMSARQPSMSTINPLGLETMTPGPQYGVDLSAGPRELYQHYSGYQDNPTIDNLHERIRRLQRPISEQTDPTSKFDIHLSLLDIHLHLPHAQHDLSTTTSHSSSSSTSHQDQKGNRTESSKSTPPADPTRTMCQDRSNPCTRHRPSGGHVHAASLPPPHHSDPLLQI